MKKNIAGRKTWFFLLAGAASAAVYLRWVRPWQLRWGATEWEVVQPMPGDAIVERPTFNATRAVTIFASPEQIWPWIAQIGFGRAGWYSYDLLDNLGRPSARKIIPKLQAIQPGDLIPLGPKVGLYVKDFKPNQWMLWDDKGQNKTSWAWGLYPLKDGSTRLVTRIRLRYSWLSPLILFDLLMEFADIIMLRKCMLGIKARAEILAETRLISQAGAG